jgi:uncharacterized protein (TIGR03083 family)
MDRHAVIAAESDRFAEVLADTPAEVRCPTCPDWDAADLLWHLTEVQLFWAGILGREVRDQAGVDAVEGSKPDRPTDTAGLLRLREEATAALLEQLGRLSDEEPRWSWWDADQTVGFTRRMQTYEATMHRVDAERTAGLPAGPIAPDVAAGAVDHCVDVMWGWLPPGTRYEPLALVELVATDSDQQWLVEVGHWTGTDTESGEKYDVPRAVRAAGGEPTATVRATVPELALWAWNRGGTVEVTGEPPALAALQALIDYGIQ